MKNASLWKCLTKERQLEFLLSLRLLGNTDWPAEKQLACIYTVSKHVERHYTPFTIQKRDGTARELLSPDPLLKKIQGNILHNILEELPVSPHATAYHKGADILQNASRHKGQKLILKMDIKNFFGSIPFAMVYRAAFSNSYYPPAIATLLTNLCCYRHYLPQGAPTSATLSNLVMRPFDDFMGKWCRKRDIVYTRYCDDMTFSGNFNAKAVISKASRFLLAMGFEINENKTRIISNHHRQSVTGIVVNKKLQVSREYRHKLRQEIYYCNKYGVAAHLVQMNNRRYLPPEPKQIERYLRSLLGKVNFVLHVDPNNRYFIQAKAAIQAMIIELIPSGPANV